MCMECSEQVRSGCWGTSTRRTCTLGPEACDLHHRNIPAQSKSVRRMVNELKVASAVDFLIFRKQQFEIMFALPEAPPSDVISWMRQLRISGKYRSLHF
ncbi:hypothetical protein ANANG_G00176730 [Anguilla anguilla]|uniref:Uncharacterized protein n=1 Tax=Anguilla anguilla TaxID=7936 RepID=A0A9D3RTD6_ANGAN|nr:hypothetical protein ANANG_G00176730 [Anguilla anguilla]